MCNSSISLRKYLKLYLWIITYALLINGVFLISGRIHFGPRLLLSLLPFTNIHSNSFTSAFMMWYLFIPFLNILLRGITRRQHQLLIMLLLLVFSIYPFVPVYLNIDNNPICWFSTVYVIAAYIRKYPDYVYKCESAKVWGGITACLILVATASVIALLWLRQNYGLSVSQYGMIADSDKPLAILIAVSSFLWFKNKKIGNDGYNKWINILGGASFGVLLIHSNSFAMRKWLWVDIFDCVGHYNLPLCQLILYAIIVVILIYLVCTAIDYARLTVIEKPFFRWYDKKKDSQT